MQEIIKLYLEKREYMPDGEAIRLIGLIERINPRPKRSIPVAKEKPTKEPEKIGLVKPRKSTMLDAKRWGGKYKQCSECGTTEKHHSGGGLCGTCYQRKRRRDKEEKKEGTIKKEYVCGDCQEEFISTLKEEDVRCPRCNSSEIGEAAINERGN